VESAETFLDPFIRLTVIMTHEAGHTIVAWHSPIVLEVRNVWIDLAAKEAGCRMVQNIRQDPSDWFEEAVLAMAGMAAEDLCLGDFKVAIATKDLANATDAARMARHFGTRWRERPPPTRFLSRVGNRVPRDCQRFVQYAFDTARARLESRRADLDGLYTLLLADCLEGRVVFPASRFIDILGPRPEPIADMKGR
jgi:hypothetical protein